LREGIVEMLGKFEHVENIRVHAGTCFNTGREDRILGMVKRNLMELDLGVIVTMEKIVRRNVRWRKTNGPTMSSPECYDVV